MSRHKILLAGLLLLIILAGGLGFANLARRHDIRQKVLSVSADWDALRKGMRNLGIDNCGAYLPTDTSWRSKERPTFETVITIHPTAPRGPSGCRHTRLLTTPVAYIRQYPTDPFVPGKGYGFLAWSFFDREPCMALLQSVGPDGDVDVSLARLYAILNDTLEEVEPGSKIPFKRTDACFVRMLDRFGYDPTNGIASSGDLIQLSCLYGGNRVLGPGPLGSAAETTRTVISDAEMNALLEKFPEGTEIPLPRWRDAEGETSFPPLTENLYPVRGFFYRHFKAYLAPDSRAGKEPLESLTNKLGAFSDFFNEIGPLTEQQSSVLNQWRKDDPSWWGLIDNVPAPKPDQPYGYAYMDINRYSEFYVFYGKSMLLRGGQLFAQGAYKEALQTACVIQNSASDLNTAYYVKPAPPLAKRAGDEIGRMARQLRALAETKIPVEKKR